MSELGERLEKAAAFGAVSTHMRALLREAAAALSRYEAERDEVTLLLRKAREAKNGTARDFDGEALSGFVLDHRDYLAMHCLLNQEAEDRRLSSPDRVGSE